jgi:hypothetical protein
MESIKNDIDAYIARAGLEAPTEPRYTPVWTPETEPAALVQRLQRAVQHVPGVDDSERACREALRFARGALGAPRAPIALADLRAPADAHAHDDDERLVAVAAQRLRRGVGEERGFGLGFGECGDTRLPPPTAERCYKQLQLPLR